MFGYSRNDLMGLSVEKLVPEDHRFEHVKSRHMYNESPTKRRMGEHLATEGLRKDGRVFIMATALSATKTPNGILVTCIIRDLSEKLEAAANRPTAHED